MRLPRLAAAITAAALASNSYALHAEDAGKVDWHTKLIGIPLPDRPFVPNFHRVPPYRFKQSWKSVILTATEANVVAGLNPADSSVGVLFQNGLICPPQSNAHSPRSMEEKVRARRSHCQHED
jgi:hypothetical protein